MPLIRIDVIEGRTDAELTGIGDAVHHALYALVASGIAERTSTRREDVFITLVENTRGDWSFGNGVAQYLTLPKEAWR